MPRKKGAPSRRLVLPIAGAREDDEPDYIEALDKSAVACGRPKQRESEIDLEPEPDSRPTKRRRNTLTLEPWKFNIHVNVIEVHKLLGFLQLDGVLAAVDEDGDAAPAVVRVSGTGKPDEASSCSLECRYLASGQSLTAHLTSPNLATARNLVRLLQDGVLGLALQSACGPDAFSRSSQPVMYAWNSESPPIRLFQQALPGALVTGTSQDVRCAGRQLEAVTPPVSLNGESWQPAVYVARPNFSVLNCWTCDDGSKRTPISSVTASSAMPLTTAGTSASAASVVTTSLRLGVCAAALERLKASDPEDGHQHAWQAQLLDVLGWLLPHILVDGAKVNQPAPLLQPPLPGVPLEAPPTPTGAGAPMLNGSAAGSMERSLVRSPERSAFTEGITGGTTPLPTQTMSPGSAAAAGQGFDPGWLYGAVKPAGGAPQWLDDPLELRPRLRPYQRRAVAWMLQRERAPRDEGGRVGTELGGAGDGITAGRLQGRATDRPEAAAVEPQGFRSASLHPLWRRLYTLPGSATEALYVNAYTGALASEPFTAPRPVRGGILADEMGLGKTVELLALITAHRFVPSLSKPQPMLKVAETNAAAAAKGGGSKKRDKGGTAPRREGQRPPERVKCPCGVRADDPNDPSVEDYGGLWILCECCNAWMHGACVGVTKAPRDAWVCTRCLRDRALATVSEPCGATLIVVPSAILQQWYDEIRRHVHPGALQVVVYGGQMQPGISSAGHHLVGAFTGAGGNGGNTAAAAAAAAAAGGRRRPVAGGSRGDEVDVAASMVVTASDLAAADVVLTTYDVLKRDVARQPDLQVPERNLRHGKRYEVVPTPLTRLCWWRVVLDEAQMVESSTAKATEMALKLDAVHRWCVTGTPISRGLEDVYGLLAFLDARPWSQRRWWNRCVQRPVEAGDPAGRQLLLRLLRPSVEPDIRGGGGGGSCNGGLMWRNGKRDVEEELGLPPQSTHISHLRLNAVELHFYNRQHQDCAAKARAVLPPRVVAAMESGRLLGGAEVQSEEDAQGAAGVRGDDSGEWEQEPSRQDGLGRGSITREEVTPAVVVGPGPAREQRQAEVQEEGKELPDMRLGRQEGGVGLPDTLRELHDIQRRRWELWRQGGENEERPGRAGVSGEFALSIGGPSATSGERLPHDDPMFVDCSEGRATVAEAAGGGGNGVGERRALRGCSPPRLEGPRKALMVMAASLDRPLASHEARKLLGPLLKLRQACCHPQVGAGGIRALTATGQPHHHHYHHHAAGSGGSHHNAPMTMTDILAVLVTRAKVEAEEAQRQLIAAFNGLSALMIIQGDIAEAIGTYRKALRVMEDNKPDIDTDPLQRLHTLHNLDQMLATAAAACDTAALAAIPRTLRDHTLAEDAAAIRNRYLEQRRQKLASEEAAYKELILTSLPFHGAAGWYLAAIDLLVVEGHGQTAVNYIKEKLLEGDTYRQKTEVNASSLANRFSSLLGLKMLLNDSLDAIEEHRAEAMRLLDDLGTRTRESQPDPEFVEQAGQCGRCRSGPIRALVCEHCRLDERFIQWEVRLFALYSRALTAGATVTAEEAARRAQAALVRWAGHGGLHEKQGAEDQMEEGDDGGRRGANVAVANTSWRQSEAEMVLRLLVALLRQHFKRDADERHEWIMREGKAHVNRLEAQRRLLVAARSTSLAQRMLLYAHDELTMAAMRMRLAREGEPISAHEVNLKLHPAAVPVKNVELSNDRIVAEGDLRRTRGTLRYLRKLQSIQKRQQERKQQEQQQEKYQHQRYDESAAPAGCGDEPGVTDMYASAAATVGSHPDSRNLIGSQSEGGSGLGPQAHSQTRISKSAPGCPLAVQSAVPATPAPTSNTAVVDGPVATSTVLHPGDGDGDGDGDVIGGGEGDVEFCPICHDPLDCSEDCIILPCGHQMHPGCSEALMAKTVAPSTPYHQKRVTCPTCRMRVHIADIAHIHPGLDVGSERANGGAGGSGGSSGPWAGEAALAVRGSFGTKIEAVVRRIKFVLEQDATAKVLVFSGWVELLELVAAALAVNAVPHVLARGRASMATALAAFKDHPWGEGELDLLDDEGPVGEGDRQQDSAVVPDTYGPDRVSNGEGGSRRYCGGQEEVREEAEEERGSAAKKTLIRHYAASDAEGASQAPAADVGMGQQPRLPSPGPVHLPLIRDPVKQILTKPRVLLLQLKQGGAGLNLTEAQHVVLVEPQLDPAAEVQAVGRVHRIGQGRPTHVHRFVVAHTVEEQVHKLAAARACSMDMAAAVPGARSVGGGVGGDGNEHLTVRDVAILLDTRWGSNTLPPTSKTTAAGANSTAADPPADPPKLCVSDERGHGNSGMRGARVYDGSGDSTQ
ncbi:hypothetical protein Vafri_12224 [Volvox africanus]|uniref:RING-type domain-containing protein n=1 Tax=Volvox africanus TaxID=51714 RepID=A0A8J4BE20_9CHLO|nr:hypothetical protein Vafri_12224 [Volvox africanus]